MKPRFTQLGPSDRRRCGKATFPGAPASDEGARQRHRIPPEIKDKLFQPFFTTKPTGEGTGLRLSISYDNVTKKPGGTIEVESEAGAYTEFTIRLARNDHTTRARARECHDRRSRTVLDLAQRDRRLHLYKPISKKLRETA